MQPSHCYLNGCMIAAGAEEAVAKRAHVGVGSQVELEPVVDGPVPAAEDSVRETEGDAITATQSTAVVELQQPTVYPSEGILSSTKFESLKICDKLARAVQSMGHEHLTHIQDAAIPQLLKGHDLLGSARTGSTYTDLSRRSSCLCLMHSALAATVIPASNETFHLMVPPSVILPCLTRNILCIDQLRYNSLSSKITTLHLLPKDIGILFRLIDS